jgi:hypothetical protein
MIVNILKFPPLSHLADANEDIICEVLQQCGWLGLIFYVNITYALLYKKEEANIS